MNLPNPHNALALSATIAVEYCKVFPSHNHCDTTAKETSNSAAVAGRQHCLGSVGISHHIDERQDASKYKKQYYPCQNKQCVLITSLQQLMTSEPYHPAVLATPGLLVKTSTSMRWAHTSNPATLSGTSEASLWLAKRLNMPRMSCFDI